MPSRKRTGLRAALLLAVAVRVTRVEKFSNKSTEQHERQCHDCRHSQGYGVSVKKISVGEGRSRQRLFVADSHQCSQGLEQLAVLLDGAVVAVSPHNGDPQWQVPFTADYSIAVATPVWGPDNLLFVSSLASSFFVFRYPLLIPQGNKRIDA